MKNVIKRYLLILSTLLLAVFFQTDVLVSPSHPFVDENGNGIDDFEEGSGQYGDPEIRAKLYGVNFPIAELGNCGSYYECRTYCEDPVNSQACINYAKSRGFYQDDPIQTQKDKILAEAKKRLGCDSYEACLNFCEVPANYDQCHSFARSQGIVGGVVDDPSRTEVIQRAKEVLGCDSAVGCQAFCSQEENRQKCSEFARTVGLHGGEERVGPGGCTSEATCRAFCSDPANFQICSGFSSSSGGQFQGPGGCNSPESCKAYCQEHEDECRSSFGGPGVPLPGYNPQEMCNRTPNCSWSGNTCQCGYYGETQESRQKAEEYAAFCRNNPDRCGPGQTGGFGSEEARREFEDYCRRYPDRCRFTEGTYSPAPYSTPTSGGGTSGGATYGSRETQEAGCRAGGGTCDWSSGYCNCQGYTSTGGTSGGTSTPAPTSYYSAPSGMTRESQEEGCRSCGGTCNWSGDFCNCQCATSGSTSTSTPPPTSESTPPPTTSESTPAPESSPAVQGVYTIRDILQTILDFFRQ